MKVLKKFPLLLVVLLAAGAAPTYGQTTDPAPIYVGAWSVDNEWKYVTPEVLKELGTKRILFGSRSWGLAISGWVARYIKDINVVYGKRVEEGKFDAVSPDAFKDPGILNFVVDGSSKRLLFFDDFIRKEPWKFGGKIDGALQTLYYMGDKQNIDETYFPVLDALAKDFPNIKFAIATHDINAVGTTPKGKEEIAASTWNVRGGDYSEAVVKRYYGKLPIFDLRDIVSTRADGTVSSFVHTNGKTYRTMVREYCRPDGDLIHANSPEGADRLGKGFVILMAKMYCPDKFPANPDAPRPEILK
jgi:hypothetical protein